MEDELQQSDQTTRVEKTLSDDTPLEQSDQQEQDPNTEPQEPDKNLDKDSKKIDNSDNEDKPSKVEISDISSSSTTESRVPTEVQELKLAFDVDDKDSEASLTSSPRPVDVNNPVMSYLSQHHYLPSPMASQSHDLESLSHDMVSESHDHKEEMAESTNDGGDAKCKASATSVEDDVSSVTKQSPPTKPPATEKEREESVKTPDSVVKIEDITLTTESPDGSRHETPPPGPKVHALNILTSDSDAEESPPYSPVPYLSGELATTGKSRSVCMILKATHCI